MEKMQGSKNQMEPSYVSYQDTQDILNEMSNDPHLTQRLLNMASVVFQLRAWSDAAFPILSTNVNLKWLRTIHAMAYSVISNQQVKKKGKIQSITLSNRRLFEKGWSRHEIYQKSWTFKNAENLPIEVFKRLIQTNTGDRSRIDFLLLNLYKKGDQYDNLKHTKPREAYPPSFNFGLVPPPLSLAPLGWCAIIDSCNGFHARADISRMTLNQLEQMIKNEYKTINRYWKAVIQNSPNRSSNIYSIELIEAMELWR